VYLVGLVLPRSTGLLLTTQTGGVNLDAVSECGYNATRLYY
jgi:hypothetical protein